MLPKSRPRRRHVGGGPQRIFPPEGADRAAGPRLAAIGWGARRDPCWLAACHLSTWWWCLPPAPSAGPSSPAAPSLPGKLNSVAVVYCLIFFLFIFFCVCVTDFVPRGANAPAICTAWKKLRSAIGATTARTRAVFWNSL